MERSQLRRVRYRTLAVLWGACAVTHPLVAVDAGSPTTADRVVQASEAGLQSDSIFDLYLTGVEQTGHCIPGCQPCFPYPSAGMPGGTAPQGTQPPGAPLAPGTAPESVFVPPQQGALLASSTIAAAANVPGAYLDVPIPVTMLRFRFDAAYDNEFPDRAEFFYAKCGCFANPALAGPLFDPEAEGPPLPESGVDYQDIRTHLEYAFTPRLSSFAEFPVRFLNPEINDNTAGFADMNVGFKYALIADCDRYLTFQWRTYLPTGDADRGLGTDHISLEPGLLYYNQLSQRLILQAELKDWIPIDGSDFAGNVLQYGAGLGYIIHQSCHFTIMPVAEVVGWTVLDGQKFNLNALAVQSADGDTIVNWKSGVRIGFSGAETPVADGSSLYVGYGTALTGDAWYENIFRVEYRIIF